MLADTRSAVPTYKVGKVQMTCWVTNQTDLPGTARYEWRSPNSRIRAGRKAGQFWASLDGKPVPGSFPFLSSAIVAAVAAGGVRRVA